MQTENIYPSNPDNQAPDHVPVQVHDQSTFSPVVTAPDTHIPEPTIIPDPTMPTVMSGPEIAEPTVTASDEPMAVVKVLSTRGVEYGMMTIALWVAAATAAWVVLNMLNGGGGFDTVVVPVSALIVCLPVFGYFFLRLKRAELAKPSMRLDPSKRRWSQTTQFLAYIVLLVNFIFFVYSLMQKSVGGSSYSIGKAVGNLVIVLIIAGGILAYYWHDEHRSRKS